ncbi:MAG: hypothetical protein C0183_08400 [Roseiflexus castenholzii]|uniref:hypothetical protein n=1 Tax=Roseiflexus castenholzii TaxID=120962 RepID=UPI000CA93E30|nr:MAG: hypothetical protein C0183_08400 [Roseiflexus castenholzii]
MTRFDFRTFLLIFGAACVGAVWATHQRSMTAPPYGEAQIPALIWTVFATPFAMFWGWFGARREERWLAAFVCFCIYFLSTFIAARYETCVVVHGSFNLVSCFVETEQAQALANAQGHRVYFESIVAVHLIAALVTALQRALKRRTMQDASLQTANEAT